MSSGYYLRTATRNIVFLVIAATLIVGVWNCEYPQSPVKGNTLPETRLANIPANDTIAQYISLGARPEIQLYWLGDDPDGFVIGYRYRWTDVYQGQRVVQPYQTILNLVSIGTTNLVRVMIVKGTPHSLPDMYRFFSTLTYQDTAIVRAINDSLVTGRAFAVPYRSGAVQGDSVAGADSLMHLSPTTGQFIFDSPTDRNMHIFEVSSIDNNGGIDPTPAVVNFWTLASPAPIAFVTAPVANTPISSGLVDTNQIAIRYATDRFEGIRIDFGAIDQSTDDRVFSWAVDDTVNASSWSPWSESTTAYVTAIQFKPIVTGWHKFYVRAKNRWGVLSNIATYTHSSGQGSFKATIVAIDDSTTPKRILFINNTQSGNGTLGSPDSNQIKAFYSEVMDSLSLTGKFDIATSTPGAGGGLSWLGETTGLIRLGQYSTVILLMEKRHQGLPGVFQLNSDRRQNIERYLQAGGNLIVVGPIDTNSTTGTLVSGWGVFSERFLHVVGITVSGARNCVGARGNINYPTMRVDAAKLPPDSSGAIRGVISGRPKGFGESVGSYLATGTDSLTMILRSVGVRYLAQEPIPPARRTFSTVWFGTPLYYLEKSAVIRGLRRALQDLHEIQ